MKPFRDEVVISTKFGISFSEYTHGDIIPDARPEKIHQSVEGSLKRLQTETIDLYFQHRIDPKVEPEVVAEVMGELIKEGKIRHWGVSVAPEDYIRRAHKVTPISAVQDRYSMMARGIEKLFPTLEELGIGFVAYSPLANGLLSGAYEKPRIRTSKLWSITAPVCRSSRRKP
ncbi:aldo/keto reductase [Parasutterella sp.]|uniref:aldo/keto reductase n=1 Tax=Parasutterella sp. TaxID=2049037 RepID=UPI0039A145A1